jgi:hypothetical protein
MYVTTVHENCTAEYTLGAMLTGTNSLAVVSMLHGSTKSLPNAKRPMLETEGGSVIDCSAVQVKNAKFGIVTREVF